MHITTLQHLLLPVTGAEYALHGVIDQEFWNRRSTKTKRFFFKVILPESLEKAFTRSVRSGRNGPAVDEAVEQTYNVLADEC